MKARITDTLLRRERGPKFRKEIYDTAEPGYVALLLPSGKISLYWYQDRGAKKHKLGNWPDFDADAGRELCKQRKQASGADTTRRITLESFIADVYSPDYVLHHKNDKHLDTLKPFRRAWGNLDLDEITEDMADDWRSQRRRDGIKPSTINRNITALKAALSFAVRKKYLAVNPLRGMRRLKVEQENRVRYLTNDEEKALRDAVDAREAKLRLERASANQWRAVRGYESLEDLSNLPFADHLKPMILVSLNTGLRQGELFSLLWADVVNDEVITVQSGKSKSLRTRHVPLNREARDTVKSWRAQTGGQGYVFASVDGEPFDNVKRAWTTVSSGLVDFHWHDMRHHFASRLVIRGVPLNTVRELLGHSDIKMTLRYAHLAPGHMREAVELLSHA